MRYTFILICFLGIGVKLYGQDFVATLEREDSLIIKEIERYKVVVDFMVRNKHLIRKEFLKSDRMLAVNKNLIDSISKRKRTFDDIKKLFSDSLLLNIQSPINIWIENNEKVICFYVRERKAIRFKSEINSICMLKYRDSNVPEDRNWWDGNEMVSYTINKNWSYIIKAN